MLTPWSLVQWSLAILVSSGLIGVACVVIATLVGLAQMLLREESW